MQDPKDGSIYNGSVSKTEPGVFFMTLPEFASTFEEYFANYNVAGYSVQRYRMLDDTIAKTIDKKFSTSALGQKQKA